MALPRFQYTGSWENPADFPTHEYSEAQVRRDIMRYFTEIQTFLNRTLIPLLEADGYGPDGSGSGGGDGQGVSGDWLPKAGGQMTGPLLLYDNPTHLSEAATKEYVDNTSSLIAEGLDGAIAALTVDVGEIRARVDDGLGNSTDISITPGKIEALLRDDLGRLLEMLFSAEQMKIHFQDGLQNSGIDMSAEDFRLWFDNMAGKMAEILMNDSEISAHVKDEAEGLETTVSITADGLTSTVSDLFNDIQSIIQQRPDLISAAVTDAANGTSASLTITPDDIAFAVETAIGKAGLDINAEEIAAEVRSKLTGEFSKVTMTESQIEQVVANALSNSQILQDASAIRQIVENLETGQSSQFNLTAEQIDFITRGVNGEFSSFTMTEDEIKQIVGDGLTKEAVLKIMQSEIEMKVSEAVKNATFSISPDGIKMMVSNALTDDVTVQEVLQGLIRNYVKGPNGSTEMVQTDTELRQLVVGPDHADDFSSLSLTANGIYGTVQNHTGQIAVLNTTAEEINATVMGVDGRVGALSVRADGITSAVEEQGRAVSAIQQTADSITQRVESAETDINGLSTQYSQISQTVNGITLETHRDGADAMIELLVPGRQPVSGLIRMTGNVDVSGSLSAEALYSRKGEIADLAVDQLSTSRRVVMYLRGDTSDDNFVRIHNQSVEWVAGHCLGSTEQARTPDGHPLYWEQDITGCSLTADGYPIVDGVRVYTTTTPTAYQTNVYQYREEVKRSISFDTVGSIYTPVDIYGAGNAQGWNKGRIVKSVDGFDLLYTSNQNGREVGIRMTNDGFVDITGLRCTTGLNFSGWDSGSFSETVSGKSSPLGYHVSFDSQNRPVSITRPDGVVQTIQW